MKKSKTELLKKIHGGQTCQLIATATKLGIFDCLYEETKTIKAIASCANISLDLCHKLLLAMESLHLVDSKDNLHFFLTEEGNYLAKQSEDSLRAIAIYKGSKPVWRSLEHLYEGITTDKSPFDIAFHEDFYSYLEKNNNDFIIFHEAMELYEEKSSKKILDCYDFSSFASMIDLGGGLGSFLKELLKKSPSSKGTLFDLPKVIDLAMSKAIDFSDRDRLFFMKGDFFEKIPNGFDAYILRNILHNWDDDHCIKLLSMIKQAKSPTAKLLIFETVVEQTIEKRLGKFAMISMFIMTSGGKERTLDEFFNIAKCSGFSITNIIQTTGSKTLIELS